MKVMKRIMSLLLSLAMVATLLPAEPLFAATVNNGQISQGLPNKLAYFSFDSSVTDGGAAKATISGGTATVSTSDKMSGNGALQLSNNGYLQLTKADGSALLAGKEKITIDYYSKTATTADKSWSFTASRTNTANAYPNETYLAVQDWASTVNVQRWNNSGVRQDNQLSAASSNAWKRITIVIREDSTEVYLNGVKVNQTAADQKDPKLSEILGAGGGYCWIGRNYWDAGEFFTGSIDEFTIYDGALTRTQVEQLYSENMNASQLSAYAKSVVDKVYLGKNTAANNITTSMQLPTEVGDQVKVTWTSSNTNYITNQGLVKALNGSGVTLTATAVNRNTGATLFTQNYNVTLGTATQGQGLVANFNFDNDNLQGATQYGAAMAAYTGAAEFDAGRVGGRSLHIGNYGVKLPVSNVGSNYTVNFWFKIQYSMDKENQTLLFIGHNNPEKWVAMSNVTASGTKSTTFKIWTIDKTGETNITTHTTLNTHGLATNWRMITFAQSGTTLTAYVDGNVVASGTAPSALNGANQSVYIGTNFWDGTVWGHVDDVDVYNRTLSDQEIQMLFTGGNLNEEIVAKDKEALNLGDLSAVGNNLALPSSGANGSTIIWESSNTNVIRNDGTVIRPEGDRTETVTLKAYIAKEGEVTAYDTKEFTVTVTGLTLANVLKENMATYLEQYKRISGDSIVLPNTVPDIDHTTVTWVSSNPSIISNTGKVTSPDADTEVTLTATITYNDGVINETVTKDYVVTVVRQMYGYLLSYTNANESAALGRSLHLAYALNDNKFTALNSNTGIVFADNSGGAKNSSPNNLFRPAIFRKGDGTYGLAAYNGGVSSSYIYIYDSDDLITFKNERRFSITVPAGTNPAGLYVEYNENSKTYSILWDNGTTYYRSITSDLRGATSTTTLNAMQYPSMMPLSTLPAGCGSYSLGSKMAVDKAEYDRVVGRLGIVKNTGFEAVNIEATSRNEAISSLPTTVTAQYSDGSTAQKKVTSWNTNSIGTTPGTYTVTGTLKQTKYANPFIGQRADPCICKGDDGYYYFTASYPVRGASDPEGYDRVVLRRATTIEGLANATEVTVLDINTVNNEMPYVWAPEIHCINGKYYIFYAASISGRWAIKPHVIECTNKANIMSPSGWTRRGRVLPKAGDTRSFETGFAIDMTIFEQNGRYYVIWAQIDGFSSLYIAEVDKNAPWQCISNGVKIAVPQYSWERINENVNEGASIIKSTNGKIYCAFSASATGPEYCIGLLMADQNANLLDVNSWYKQPFPVLTSADVSGEYGPGHNSFTVDEDGNPIFVYHARGTTCYQNKCQWGNDDPLVDPCRDARLKRVHWAADGTPILKMSYAEELATTTVTATVTVGSKFNVSYSAGSGGTISGTANQSVIQGKDATSVTAVPNNGYKFVRWSDGVTTATRTDKNINSNLYVTAEFSRLVGVTSVQVPSTSMTVVKGTTKDIGTVTVLPADTTEDKSVTYKSNNAYIATVNNNGTITGVDYGKTTISVTSVSNPNAKAIIDVEVVDGAEFTEAIEADKAALTIDTTVSEAGQMNLPTTGANGSIITWDSNNKAVISNAGLVTPVEGETISVTLTATITNGGLSDTKQFVVTVVGDPAIAAEKEATKVMENITDGIANGVTLPVVTESGAQVTWTTDNANVTVNPNTGVVTVSNGLKEDTDVSFTATVSYNGATVNKSETVTVSYNKAVVDDEITTADKNALQYPTIVNGTITLVTQGANGSTITWTSDNDAIVIAADGKSATVHPGTEEVRVNLKATIKYGDAEKTQQYRITVAADKTIVARQELAQDAEAAQEFLDGLRERDYTEESWNAVEDAIEAAQNLANKPNATEAEINAAKKALEDALDGLKTLQEVLEEAKAALSTSVTTIKNEMAGLNEEDYEADSWKALEDAISEAEFILSFSSASQLLVDEAAEKLTKARNELKEKEAPPINTTTLTTFISIAEAVTNESAYTPASWEALQNALLQAKLIAGNSNVNQQAIDEAAANLQAAVAGLTEVAVKTALNLAITQASGLDANAYTEESWNAFSLVLQQAKDLAANANASQDQVDAMSSQLRAAITALAPLADKSDLNGEIAKAKALNEEDYTTTSWAALQAAIQAAEDVAAERDADQADVDAAKSSLAATVVALVKVADKTRLESAIASAKRLDSENYTQDSWNSLQAALAEAEALLANRDATQAAVDAERIKLNAAIDALEEHVPVVVDKSELNQKLSDVASLRKDDYTATSWAALQEAMEEALDVIADSNASQTAVNRAVEDLDSAVNALVNAADKSALRAAIAEAESLKATDFTEASWTALQGALVAAKEMDEDGDAKQALIDVTTMLLNNALDGLVRLVDKSALEELIEEAEALKEEDYTTVSWKLLEIILSAAKEVMDDSNARQSAVDEAVTELAAAIRDLEKPVVEVVNKEALADKIAAIEGLKEADYTSATWSALQAVLTVAKAELEKEDATQETIDMILGELTKAEAGLKPATVTPPPVQKPVQQTQISLNIVKLTMGMKEKVLLTPQVTGPAAGYAITWTSNNPKVATVAADGKITGKKKGSAIITATTVDGKSATCSVTVKKAPKKITLKKKSATLKKGKTTKIKVKFPSGTASYKLTYKSSKKKIATVDATGKVTAKKKGTAKITVTTFNKKKATFTVKVK